MRRTELVHRLELFEARDIVPSDRQPSTNAQPGNAKSDDSDLQSAPSTRDEGGLESG